jgi:Outer membrane protein beta-barrel domain
MSNEKDKNLDDLFRKKLQDPADEAGFREEDWDALEEMLDEKKKRRGIIFWLPVLGSVAALLLLFLGWWAFRPQISGSNTSNNNMAITSSHTKTNTGSNGGTVRQPEGVKQSNPLPESQASTSQPGKSISGSKSFLTLSASGTRRNSGYRSSTHHKTANTEEESIAAIDNNNDIVQNGKNSIDNKGIVQNDRKNIAANKIKNKRTLEAIAPAYDFNSGNISDQNVAAVKLPVKNAIIAVLHEPKVKVKSSFHTQYALTVLAAPDANGVGSFQQSKLGTNFGVAFSADVSKKFTITTGAMYSVKPYSAENGQYHLDYQPAVTPSAFTADCRMLDIPVNVGYQIYNKHQNRISLGTGLSSYIMLHESYTFNYADSYVSPTHFTVPNSNKYFFGVANFNATYEHRLNSKASIMLQPYLKLPLTNIGYSQVRLQTTGVAVGLHWNLNSLSKP